MSNSVQTKKNLTVFGSETVFDGELSFTDDLIITGRFSGKIEATGNLEIEKDAVCNVQKINANSIIVSGKVIGDLFAKSNVQLRNGSVVEGNIKTKRLRIEDNVDFVGSVTMMEDKNDIDLFSVDTADYKTTIRRAEG